MTTDAREREGRFKPFPPEWIEARRKTLDGMAKMLARQPRTEDRRELANRHEREEFIEHESRWLATVDRCRQDRADRAESALATATRERAGYALRVAPVIAAVRALGFQPEATGNGAPGFWVGSLFTREDVAPALTALRDALRTYDLASRGDDAVLEPTDTTPRGSGAKNLDGLRVTQAPIGREKPADRLETTRENERTTRPQEPASAPSSPGGSGAGAMLPEERAFLRALAANPPTWASDIIATARALAAGGGGAEALDTLDEWRSASSTLTKGYHAAPLHLGASVRGLSFDALRALNVPRVAAFGQTLASWSPMEWACAAAGEMGELCNVLKKRSRKEDPKRPGCDITGKPIPTSRDVADEIADVIIYLDLLAAREGIDVAEAVARKWNETSEKMGHAPRLPLSRLAPPGPREGRGEGK